MYYFTFQSNSLSLLFNRIQMYIYSKNSIFEAIKSDKNIQKIYISYNLSEDVASSLYSIARRKNIPIVKYDKRKFIELEKRALPTGIKSQGVIAILDPIETIVLEEMIQKAYKKTKNPVLLLLDGITDPQNLGAVARTALCAGANGIVLPERNSAPITSAVIKSSAGAIEHIPIARINNLSLAIKKLKDNNFWIIGADSRAERVYTDDIYNSPIAIVIGSEGKGMHQSIKKLCDFLVKIPMSGNFDSLNVSVATGIVLFEMLRQRNYSKTLP